MVCAAFGADCGRYAGGPTGGVVGGGSAALRCKTRGVACGLYAGGAAGCGLALAGAALFVCTTGGLKW